ncbi:2-oxo acid dehydrogenase subunit E2, partial [Yoonia sp.]|nr:2-oxo acid dehydrogenase subunit E2 [Yoonia sp.]
RVRQGRFRARELSDPTITLTSLGDRGVTEITGVIFPLQVAIVGIGAPHWQAVVRDGNVVARRIATITLAADHRVSDGHRGSGFLRAIINHLQNPEAL